MKTDRKNLAFLGKICIGYIFFFLVTIANCQLVKAQENEIHLGLPLPTGGEQPPTDRVTGIIDYTRNLYLFATIAASTLAAVMIIYGGIKYLFSGGTPEKVNDAKEIIISAISGLLLLIFANLFLRLILPENII